MPILDFENPIKTFGSSDTYTANDGDFLFIGVLTCSTYTGNTSIKIDNTIISTFSFDSQQRITALPMEGAIKLSSGQVVTTDSNFATNLSKVYILNTIQ